MVKKPGKKRNQGAQPDRTPSAGPRPARGGGNPELASQNRRLMGKHYAAKYGVRKGRG